MGTARDGVGRQGNRTREWTMLLLVAGQQMLDHELNPSVLATTCLLYTSDAADE